MHIEKINKILHSSYYTPYLRIRDKDSFISPQEFVVGYSKAPEQPQSSARPICHSHTMTSMGREPATMHIAAYTSSTHYALCHGRRQELYLIILFEIKCICNVGKRLITDNRVMSFALKLWLK